MLIAVVAGGLIVLLLAARFLRGLRQGYSGGAQGATRGPDTGARRPNPQPREKSHMQRMLDDDQDRRRRDDGRRASEQAAANARRTNEEIARRNARTQAEHNRLAQNAFKRNRGW
jgi:hypothetical protein